MINWHKQIDIVIKHVLEDNKIYSVLPMPISLSVSHVYRNTFWYNCSWLIYNTYCFLPQTQTLDPFQDKSTQLMTIFCFAYFVSSSWVWVTKSLFVRVGIYLILWQYVLDPLNHGHIWKVSLRRICVVICKNSRVFGDWNLSIPTSSSLEVTNIQPLKRHCWS